MGRGAMTPADPAPRVTDADRREAREWLDMLVLPRGHTLSTERGIASLASLLASVRERERERCIQLIDYSVNEARLRKKIIARIHGGMEQHIAAIRSQPAEGGA